MILNKMELTTSISLKTRWEELKAQNPRLRIRDCAQVLGVSEAELLQTDLGNCVTLLTPPSTDELIEKLATWGNLMALTRNEAAVLEHNGPLENVQISKGHRGGVLVTQGPLELRGFLGQWVNVFAVETESPRGTLRSIQIFDATGTAVVKFYLKEESQIEGYRRLVGEWATPIQTPINEFAPKQKQPTAPVSTVDGDAFKAEWAALKDTHDFHMLVAKYRLNRQDALDLAGSQWAEKISKEELQAVLEHCAANQLPIMIFVGNPGNIQIHQDLIHKVQPLENWLNIMDDGFNMHLQMNLITDAYKVRKPTTDGMVTSLELFTADKELAVQFFGLRKPGIPEREDWRALVEALPTI